MKIFKVPATATAFCISICTLATAYGAPGDNLPRPEDPVFLPSEEEVAQHMATRRAAWLQYLQHDPDGWDDLWVLIQQSYDKNYQFDPKDKAKDTDGDGIADYEEMLLNRDATRKEPVYTREQQIELIRDARRQAIRGAIASDAEQTRLRAIFAPWMHTDIPSGIPGKSFSIEEERKAKRARLAQSISALEQAEKIQLLAGKAAANRIGLSDRFQLPGGGSAVVVGESNGVPQLHFTRNVVAADTISTDNLWPAGSSGLALNGTESGQPSVRLGVWEPLGPLLQHTEFADSVSTIDGANALNTWSAGTGGSIALNTTAGNMVEGTGCLDLRKTAGSSATILYSKTQTAANFTGSVLTVFYFIDNPADLAATGAVQVRYGSSSSAYWYRTYDRLDIFAGWNYLNLAVPNATGTTGSPTITSCTFTALNIPMLRRR